MQLSTQFLPKFYMCMVASFPSSQLPWLWNWDPDTAVRFRYCVQPCVLRVRGRVSGAAKGTGWLIGSTRSPGMFCSLRGAENLGWGYCLRYVHDFLDFSSPRMTAESFQRSESCLLIAVGTSAVDDSMIPLWQTAHLCNHQEYVVFVYSKTVLNQQNYRQVLSSTHYYCILPKIIGQLLRLDQTCFVYQLLFEIILHKTSQNLIFPMDE